MLRLMAFDLHDICRSDPVCFTANLTHGCFVAPTPSAILFLKKEVRSERMDTTLAIILIIVAAVVGIGAGAVGYFVSKIRRRWYEEYLSNLDALADALLDQLNQ